MWKYRLHKLFRAGRSIRRYLPNTAVCNTASLQSYLNKYKMVYIKPMGGDRGRGIIRAWKSNNKYAYVVVRGKPSYCSSVKELYRRLHLTSKSHIVQRGIRLARINGRPFDVRVMIMRNRKGRWTYVGMLAKVAGKRSIITNVARGGGYALKIENALRRSLNANGAKIKRIKHELIRLGLNSSRRFNRLRYDWQIGFDMAVDRSGKVWFIEANPRYPSHPLFAKLKDKTMYRKIKRFASWNKNKILKKK